MEKNLYRSSENKILGGVCSGLADYFNINKILLRFLFVFMSIFNFHIAVMLSVGYILFWILVPSKPTF